MKSNKLDKEIKNQLQDREISPSRNLWTEIEADLKNAEIAPQTQKKNNNWIWLAASFILIAGLTFFVMKPQQETQPQIVSAPKTVEKVITDSIFIDKPVLESQEKIITENSVEEKSVLAENESSKSVQEKKQIIEKSVTRPENIQPEKATAIIPEINNKTIAVADTASSKPSRVRYTDPSTLLFSVEHKDALQSAKKGSNVAAIELNK